MRTQDLTESLSWVHAGAAVSVLTLLLAILLIRRRRSSRGAGVVLLIMAIAMHAALLIYLPPLRLFGGGKTVVADVDDTLESASIDVVLSTFDPQVDADEGSARDAQNDPPSPLDSPLPISELSDLLDGDHKAEDDLSLSEESEASVDRPQTLQVPIPRTLASPPKSVQSKTIPAELAPIATDGDAAVSSDDEVHNPSRLSQPDRFAEAVDRWLDEDTESPVQKLVDDETVDSADETRMAAETGLMLNEAEHEEAAGKAESEAIRPDSLASNLREVSPPVSSQQSSPNEPAAPPANRKASPASGQFLPAETQDDFASRVGAAKQAAIVQTGGDVDTEAAVAAALAFLVAGQKSDGGWDPAAAGAGRERAPLGYRRGGAGTNAETALTGLSLLALMGSGNTHRAGQYRENVYAGLARLISLQQPDGSMAGNASVYSATYCHGMASLAICEAAAMTKDASAIDSARRAIGWTTSMQHPITGGWRYTQGDPGDLSQLGWQAMVLDAGHRAGIEIQPQSVRGIDRFLRSVRSGRSGGLASYRPGELPSRTMTAESLATSLLAGLPVSEAAVAEAEAHLMAELPGTSVDNYYYWYYATIALHQLQDDAWQNWNQALKSRLLTTQQPDGSWDSGTLWGGYGGTIYTTAMATLCLETYYRHQLRTGSKMAQLPISNLRR